MRYHFIFALSLVYLAANVAACGDDSDGGLTDAQRHGVGAACKVDADCFVAKTPLKCLPFKGGYCGLADCQADIDCPAGSACVAHDDGGNYCFLLCVDKPACNYTRPSDIEANCSSSISFVEGKHSSKACVPPS